jgi:hypothetical protein
MNNLKFKILTFFWILALCGNSFNSYSQRADVSRKDIKEFRKAQLAANYVILDSLITSRNFVLQANYLENKYGDRVNVAPNLNFIQVNGPTGVLQTGLVSGMGFNGVGGVTAEGNLASWEILKNAKKLTLNVQFSLVTNIGNYDISMFVTPDNVASATIRGLGPGSLTWKGHLVAPGSSRVFKGRDTY